MRVSFRSVLLASGFTVVLVVFGSVRLLGTPDKGRDADTRAINDVLSAQQSAWNRGDVDAFLVGYWRSPELTFSGSSGVSRGWDGVLARYKKSYPNHAAMGQLEFSDGVSLPGAGRSARSWPMALEARERRHRGSVHAGVAEVSGRLENHSRSHKRGRGKTVAMAPANRGQG